MSSSADGQPQLTAKTTGDSLGMTFLTYAHVILPPLLMFVAQGPYSLRVWSAVKYIRKNGFRDKLGEDRKPKMETWEKVLIGVVMIISFISTVVIMRLRPDMYLVPLVFAGLSYVIVWPIVAGCLLVIPGVRKIVVRIDERGSPVQADIISESALMRVIEIMLILTGAIITFLAFIFHVSTCLAIVYAAALYLFGQFHSRNKAGKIPLTTIRFPIMLFSTYSIILCSIAILIMILPARRNKSRNPEEAGPNDFVMAYHQFMLWWLMVATALLHQSLISVCYRFDYSNSCASDYNADSDTGIFVKTTSPVVSGLYLPPHISRKFPKPYYIATITAWCSATAFLLSLAASDCLPSIIYFDDNMFGLFVMISAIPFMPLSVLGLAAIRGELKEMWKYQEDWSVAPREFPEEVRLLSSI